MHYGEILISGLYYKNMIMVKDETSWSATLESSIMLQELSITLLDNIYSADFT